MIYAIIDGARIACESMRLGAGDVLTIRATDERRTMDELVSMLESAGDIRKEDGAQGVTAVYRGRKLTTITLETVGGRRVVTASMQVETLTQSTEDKLRDEIEALRDALDRASAESEERANESDSALVELAGMTAASAEALCELISLSRQTMDRLDEQDAALCELAQMIADIPAPEETPPNTEAAPEAGGETESENDVSQEVNGHGEDLSADDPDGQNGA